MTNEHEKLSAEFKTRYQAWIRDLEKSGQFPQGLEFFEVFRRINLDSQEKTRQMIEENKSLLSRLEKLGTVLSLLDRLSSCAWGCRGGSHAIEYSIRKALSYSVGAITLAEKSFYNESIQLIRSITEIANLFWLFLHNPISFQEWHSASDKDRRKNFSPVKVRTKLEELGSEIPFDKDHYSLMSEIGVHLSPVMPQMYDFTDLAYNGFQRMGFVVVLNEVSNAVGIVAIAAQYMVDLKEEKIQEITSALQELSEVIGNLGLDEAKKLKEDDRIKELMHRLIMKRGKGQFRNISLYVFF